MTCDRVNLFGGAGVPSFSLSHSFVAVLPKSTSTWNVICGYGCSFSSSRVSTLSSHTHMRAQVYACGYTTVHTHVFKWGYA